jgi:hypothetical protein
VTRSENGPKRTQRYEPLTVVRTNSKLADGTAPATPRSSLLLDGSGRSARRLIDLLSVVRCTPLETVCPPAGALTGASAPAE